MASLVYHNAIRKTLTGDIDFDTDTFYMMLVTSSYTPDKDTHDFRDDVTNEVANGNGYTTNGKAVTVTVEAIDTTNDRVEISFADVTWSTSTITAAGAVVYKYRAGASSADELVCFLDFGGNVSSQGGDFVVSTTQGIRFSN